MKIYTDLLSRQVLGVDDYIKLTDGLDAVSMGSSSSSNSFSISSGNRNQSPPGALSERNGNYSSTSFLPSPNERHTQADLTNANSINIGMTRDQVITRMDYPPKRIVKNDIIEWHYCKTGRQFDDIFTVLFHSGEVILTKRYRVTADDNNGEFGDCLKLIKMGSYTEPKWIEDLRARN